MPYCYICPHRCGVDRPLTLADSAEGRCFGSCGCGLAPIVARAALHRWEEPCSSGTRGAGAVFFSGCNLHCVFCQNFSVSSKNGYGDGFGIEIDVPRLRQIYRELIEEGAHNIDLVTPTHFAQAVAESLDAPLGVPVIYNCGGFETLDTLAKLKGKIDIYLPDLKWYDDVAAVKYSNAPSYFRVATAAIEAMYEQVGAYKLDEDGLLQKGVLIRHLIMPGFLDDTKKIIDWVAKTFKPGQVLFSLMRQYVPCGRAKEYPEIDRTLSDEEYKEAEAYLLASSIEDGYLQEEAACASEDFIPAFDGTGVLKKAEN